MFVLAAAFLAFVSAADGASAPGGAAPAGAAAAGEEAPEENPSADPEPAPRPPEPDVRREFERRYAAWKVYLERPEIRVRSDVSSRLNHDTFRTLADLGPRAVPFVLERLPENRFLAFALERMTRRKLSAEEKERASTLEGSIEVWRSWWVEGRNAEAGRFAEAYRDWRKAIASGECRLESEEIRLEPDTGRRSQNRSVSALGQAAARIRAVGLDALPWLESRIRAGDRSLLPIVSDLTDGLGATDIGSPEERVRFTLEWWEANRDRWTLPDAPPDPGDIPMDSPPAALPAPSGPAAPRPADEGRPFPGAGFAFIGAAAGLLAGLALGWRMRRAGRRP
ncbi:MAG: hypothetical protein AAB215_06055 [Planctomycetota bacterium]